MPELKTRAVPENNYIEDNYNKGSINSTCLNVITKLFLEHSSNIHDSQKQLMLPLKCHIPQ